MKAIFAGSMIYSNPVVGFDPLKLGIFSGPSITEIHSSSIDNPFDCNKSSRDVCNIWHDTKGRLSALDFTIRVLFDA